MVTSNDKWFNEIDGEQAFPSLGQTHESGTPPRTAFHGIGHAYQGRRSAPVREAPA